MAHNIDVASELFARRVQYETAGLDVADVAGRSDRPVAVVVRRRQLGRRDRAQRDGAGHRPTRTATPTPATCSCAASTTTGSCSTPTTTAPRAVRSAPTPAAPACSRGSTLHRQVRVRGPMSRVSAAESDAYFDSRPRDSQIGAWASPQSEVIADRADLDRRIAETAAEFEGRDVSAPGVLGWLAPRGRRDRVLAGPPEPPPRPRPLPARRRRRLGRRAPRAVTLDSLLEDCAAAGSALARRPSVDRVDRRSAGLGGGQPLDLTIHARCGRAPSVTT